MFGLQTNVFKTERKNVSLFSIVNCFSKKCFLSLKKSVDNGALDDKMKEKFFFFYLQD